MPMHDWTRIDPNDYHDFHLSWIAALKSALNNGRLPPGYFALAEHTLRPFVPDVVTLSVPDTSPGGANEPGGVAVAAAPGPMITATALGRGKTVGRRRVTIQHARSRHIVAVIEIVSPGNKAKKSQFIDLVGKSVDFLRHGVHVLLIDPFPPTSRDPNGIHAVVWKRLTGETFTPPDGKPLTLASYVARGANTFSTFVEPLAVGDLLRDMPLFLTDELHILTPLEETYQVAWQGFPSFLRAIVTPPP